MNKLLLGIFACTLISCNAKIVHDRLQTGKIVRDCTGTYIKLDNNEDYLVCNDDLLKDKEIGEKITFIYDKIDKCSKNNGKIMCMMYHENKGTIQIKSIQ